MIELFGEIENIILRGLLSLADGSFANFVVRFGIGYVPVISTLIFAWVLFVHREPYERLAKLFFTLCALMVSSILYVVLGAVILRVSPPEILGFEPLIVGEGGFPAFLPLWVATLAVCSGYLLSKRLGLWLLIASLFVALTQVIGGVHWPFDVAAGVLIGALAPLLTKKFFPVKLTQTS